jgi:hypothetical protein
MEKNTENATGLDHIKFVEDEEGEPELQTDGFFVQPMASKDLNQSDFNRFVKSVKSSVRASYEYKRFIGYLKHQVNLTRCSFLNKVDDEKATVEIHHAPFTIHDVIEIIIDHMLSIGPITTLSICNEVMQAHFMGLVGVVPLSETVHQLVHSGKIKLHPNQIYGDIPGFLERYNEGVKDIHKEKLREFLKVTEIKEMHDPRLFENEKWKDEFLHKEVTLESIREVSLLSLSEETKNRLRSPELSDLEPNESCPF